MKRFYKAVEAVSVDGGHAITLDGKPVRTPARAPFVVPSRPLAAAIAAEWDAQEDEVRPQSMPMTGLANAAIDLMATRRGEILTDAAGYADADLLCYRADAPAGLRVRQDESWQPLLDWAAEHLGLRLVVTTGVVHVAQAPGTIEAAQRHLDAYDDFTMVGISRLTQGLGSVVLAAAIAEGHLAAEDAFDLSQIDELWQESLWGVDDEAVARRVLLRQDLLDAARFMTLTRS
ncbi:ATP12 family protein [Emcibacter sp. SYSU 3D8]|uniref:ATP12 family chaperone protein n=1 Tax=Emcibacter sp. SYSU 3D8 TaxID=3133969 RepID=UPI0031FECD69